MAQEASVIFRGGDHNLHVALCVSISLKQRGISKATKAVSVPFSVECLNCMQHRKI